MMTMKDLIEVSNQNNSSEILIVPEASARMRVGREWMEMSSQVMTPAMSKELLCSLLGPQEKQLLFETGEVHAMAISGHQQLNLHVQLSEEGVLGSVKWLNDNFLKSEFWDFPDFMMESIQRGPGLHFFAGSRDGSLQSAVMSLIQNISAERSKHIVWLTNNKIHKIPNQKSIVTYVSQGVVPNSADIVVMDESHGCEKALKLSEAGLSVIFMSSSQSMVMGMQRMLDHLSGEMQSKLRRFATNLKIAAGVKLVPGIKEMAHGACEILVVTPEIEALLDQGRFAMLENLMHETAEKSGMRTMNQSLLSFILKRKIDFKTGFEESPEPQALDQMLKRIGY